MAVSLQADKQLRQRVQSIDVLRGIIMLLMALDHCRDYFHLYAFQFDPEDLSQSGSFTFLTRWITHFCAPAFVVLTGIAAYLYGTKQGTTRKDIAQYLLVRGLILIVLEITLVRFGWRFKIDYSSLGFLVIWALGWSMIALAALIYLPRKVLWVVSLLILFFHNLLDSITYQKYKVLDLFWAFLHQNKYVPLSDQFGVNVLYPVLPMIGLIGLGYAMGRWFTWEYKPEIRKGFLLNTGIIFFVLFILLRFVQYITHQYSYLYWENNFWSYITQYFGDPRAWDIQTIDGAVSWKYTLMSFINVTKYPMSLFFILLTLGPILILLAYLETAKGWWVKIVNTFGRVPMFYYILHLYLIHLVALLIVLFRNNFAIEGLMKKHYKVLSMEYGYPLWMVYLFWIGILLLLYPICRWFDRLKSSRKYSWMKYF